jgi:hypothetical protein
MNIYLDVDGVLLANEKETARFADKFLQAVINKYPESTYWLTTHVWRGEHRINQVLAPYLKPETVIMLDKVKPTVWGEFKTDAIDFNTNFLWFDDDLWPEEKEVLESHGVINSLVMVNLSENPDTLADLTDMITTNRVKD